MTSRAWSSEEWFALFIQISKLIECSGYKNLPWNWKIQLNCWISYQNKRSTEDQAVCRSSKRKKLSEIFAALRLSLKKKKNLCSILSVNLKLEQLFSVIEKNVLVGAQWWALPLYFFFYPIKWKTCTLRDHLCRQFMIAAYLRIV